MIFKACVTVVPRRQSLKDTSCSSLVLMAKWFEEFDWAFYAIRRMGFHPEKKFYHANCEVFRAYTPDLGTVLVKLAHDELSSHSLHLEDAVYRKLEGRVPLAKRIAFHESMPGDNAYGVAPIASIPELKLVEEMRSEIDYENSATFIRSYLEGDTLFHLQDPQEKTFVLLDELVRSMHKNSIARLDLSQPANVLVDASGQPYLFDFNACVCPGVAGTEWSRFVYKDLKDLEQLYEGDRAQKGF